MKKTLSIILSLILIVTSTLCFGITASADDETFIFNDKTNRLTINVNGAVTKSAIDELDYKDKIVRVDVSKSVTELDEGAFTSLDNLKKLVVLNPDCKFFNGDVLKNGSDITIYSPDNSETSNAKTHAENHGYKFLSVYFISFTQMGKPTLVTALEDFTAEDLINEAPELAKPHHNSKTKMVTYIFWTPTVVAPKDNPNASYVMDFDTKAHGAQTKEVLTPATCTEDGKLSVVCSLCGDEISYTTIPAHHDFSDNSEFCKVCGEPNPNYSTTAPATTKPDDTTKADDTTQASTTKQEPTSSDTSSSADVSNTTNATNTDVTVTTTAPTESTTNAIVPSTSVSTTVAPSAVTTTVASQQTTTSVQTTNTQPTAQNVTTTKAVASKPKSTKIKKLTSKKSAFSITWSKVTGVKGYQIQFATDKKFKKNKKTVNVSKQKTTNKTVKKLKSKKKYYVRIRTYKVSNGKKVYSSWSKTKTVKTK